MGMPKQKREAAELYRERVAVLEKEMERLRTENKEMLIAMTKQQAALKLAQQYFDHYRALGIIS